MMLTNTFQKLANGEKNSVHQFSNQILSGSTQKSQISKLPRLSVSLLRIQVRC